jgi:nucleotide-binding universal stress UspA family protein
MQLLVALDLQQPSDALVALAVRAAQRLQAEVHLLTVVSPGAGHATYVGNWSMPTAAERPAADTSGGLIPYPTPLSKATGVMVETRTQAAVRTLDEARDRLAGLTQHFGDHQVTVAVEVEERPAGAIATYAAQHQIDLAILGTHARGRVTRAVLGSVAEDVVQRLTIPVLLAGPHMDVNPVTGWTTLIVCVDGTPFAEAILPIAAFANRLQLQVFLVSVQSVSLPQPLAAEVQEGNYLRGLATALRRQGVDVRWEVLHGDDPAHAIGQYAAGWPGSIVALATHARHGLPRIVAGSVAMRIVSESNGPVLVMHPRALSHAAHADG